jgi:ATP-binding cassette subfamily F protein 3
VVSHDRYFVSNIANKIWYIEDNEVKEYPGSFDEYETWMASRTSEQVPVTKSKEKPKPELAPVEVTPKSKSTEKEIEKLETQIMTLENELETIEHDMAALAQASKFDDLKNLELKRNEVQQKLDETTASWELLIG